MSGQYGRSTVLRSLARMRRTGKVNAATLYRRTAGTDAFDTAQAYANAYLYPTNTSTGLGGDGFPANSARAVLWQIGETLAPNVDDRLRIDGETFAVTGVETRQNADAGFAIHDLRLSDEV